MPTARAIPKVYSTILKIRRSVVQILAIVLGLGLGLVGIVDLRNSGSISSRTQKSLISFFSLLL